NRVAPVRFALNIVATFLLSGVWHGANWTFVVWGGLHGVAMIVHSLLTKPLSGISKTLGWFGSGLAILATFATVTLGWVFFRAADLGSAVQILARMPGGWTHPGSVLAVPVPFPTMGVFGIFLMVALQAWGKTDSLEGPAAKIPRAARWALYYFLIFWTAWFGAYGGDAFIYFQF
ncbi:MAG: hypothetical protein ABI837_21180, partial [Acidobacteriota bacterium]